MPTNRYTIDFNNFWQNLLPSNKRLTKYIAWGKTLMKPLVWLQDVVFNRFYEGDSSSNWNSGTTYNRGQFVKYIDKAIYMCLVDGTIATTPLTTTSWYKVNDNFIGVKDRLKFTSQIIVFEYALNTWFGQTLVNPPTQSPVYTTSHNPIYITLNNTNTTTFISGISSEVSSTASINSVTASYYVGLNPASYSQYAFTINYPAAMYTTTIESEIRSFADKINLAGIKYNITQY